MHPIKFTTSQMSGCSSFSKAEDQKSAAKHRNRAFGRTAHRAGHFQGCVEAILGRTLSPDWDQ